MRQHASIQPIRRARGAATALLAALACAASLIAPAARAQHAIVQDALVMCSANDPEILWNMMAYQLPVSTEAANQQLFLRRLVPNPPLTDIREDTVFSAAALSLDHELAPISRSSNGPEFGFDANRGVEIVYTKEDALTHALYLARMANNCVHLNDACWSYRAFPNADVAENRWHAFASAMLPFATKVSYFRSPGAPGADQRIAWRDLEDRNLAHEHVIDDPNATFFGPWQLLDNRLQIVVVYGPPDGDQQIGLYNVTPPYTRPPLTIVSSGPGVRKEGHVAVDPASGLYTLVSVNVVGSADVMEVYQRVSGTWVHRYDFDAAQAGESNPALAYVQSPELFEHAGRLYVAFLTSDTPDFGSTTLGNIRIARIEAIGPPSFFKLLSDDTLPRKRIEPELHYPSNDGPVVFYTQRAEAGDEGGCSTGSNTLRRARTGV